VARRTGRRPGDPTETRQAILDAAVRGFAESGFEQTSIRKIAATAGVDPALVHHYFGTKDQLFVAALDIPFDPAELLPSILTGADEKAGERLVRTFLSVWDGPRGTAAAAVMRSAIAHPWIARILREFMFTRLVLPALTSLGIEEVAERERRATLVVSQVVGLALTRYVLRFEPLASAPSEEVVAAIGPTMQRYLIGSIAGDATAADGT